MIIILLITHGINSVEKSINFDVLKNYLDKSLNILQIIRSIQLDTESNVCLLNAIIKLNLKIKNNNFTCHVNVQL